MKLDIISLVILVCSIVFIGVEFFYIFKKKKYEIKKTYLFLTLILYIYMSITLLSINMYNTSTEGFVFSIINTVELLKLDSLDELIKYLSVIKFNWFPLGIVALGSLYILTIISYFNLALIIFGYSISNRLKQITIHKQKNIQIIFGFNDETKIYIENIINKAQTSAEYKDIQKGIIIIIEKDYEKKYKQIIAYLFEKNISYKLVNEKKLYNFDKLLKKFGAYSIKHDGSKDSEKNISLADDSIEIINSMKNFSTNYYVISFYKDDQTQFNFVKRCKSFLNEKGVLLNSKNKNDSVYINTRFIIVCNQNQNSYINHFIYDDYENGRYDECRGFIRTFNKYQILSYEFIKKYNFAQYLQKANIINKNLTIDNQVKIYLYLFGFGKLNENLLKDILIQNQFVTIKDGHLSPVRICVKIYDKKNTIDNLSLSSGFFKYSKKHYGKQENFLPLPDDYQIEKRFNCSIGDENILNDIYDEINENVKNGKKQVNFFIVSLGKDYDNLDFATQLSYLTDNFDKNKVLSYIFVRNQTLDKESHRENVMYFGDINDVFTYENIIADQIYEEAKYEHAVYLNNTNITNEIELHLSWAKLSYIEKMSNLYSIASLPFKLALMGYYEDLSPINKSLLSFVDSYMENQQIDKNNKGQDIISYKYSDNIIKAIDNLSKRDVLRYVEHERWVAFELNEGVLPMKKKMYKELGKTKTKNEMYHYNITTMEGLVEYYNDSGVDVIQYDDDLMDNYCIRVIKNKKE